MVLGPMTEAQAAELCGCSVQQLCHGTLAGKPEGRYGDKLRTIHDATVNHVNEWIQTHQSQRTTAPTLQDVLTCLHTLNRPDIVMLKFDVREANRRILLRQKGWRCITARIKGQVWVNKVLLRLPTDPMGLRRRG